MNGSKERKDKILTIAVWIFLSFLILWVGTHIGGVSTDEEIERNSSLVTYKHVFPSIENQVTDSVDFTKVSALDEWGDRCYGVAMQLPTVAIEHLFGFRLDLQTIYQIRHLYTALLFCIAVVFFDRLLKKTGKNRRQELLGVSLLIICPRILAESFYNIKDLIFLSIFTINVYFCICFMERRTAGQAIGVAVTTALCVNTRIIGAMAAVYCFLAIFIRQILRKEWKKDVLWLLGTGLLSIGLYVLVTPYLWSAPIAHLKEILVTFMDFTRYGGDVYYAGSVFPASDLPWHYLIGCMLVTLPLGYMFFAAVGAMDGVVRWRVKKDAERVLLLLLATPVLYSIWRRPTLYNMWRHMYFLYPLMVFEAVCGIETLMMKGKQWMRRFAACSIGLSLGVTSLWIVRNPSYGYVYFNPLAKKYVADWFEKDYWGLTTTELAERVFEITQDAERHSIHFHILSGYFGLSERLREQTEMMWDNSIAEYATYQFFSYENDLERNMYYCYPKEYEIKVDGMEIAALYDLKYDNYSQSRVVDKKGENLVYSIGGIEWSREEGTLATLEGKLTQPIWTAHITVESEEGIPAEALRVELRTENGWIEPSRELFYDSIGHYFLDAAENIYGLRLAYECQQDENSFRINLHRKTYEDLNKDFVEESPILSGNVVYNGETQDGSGAFDNDVITNWSGYSGQPAGAEYQITLRENYCIRGLQLLLGNSGYDWIRALEIYTSIDGKEWERAEFESRLNADICFKEPHKCRYIRLVLGWKVQEIENNWTIYEIVLYHQPDAEAQEEKRQE